MPQKIITVENLFNLCTYSWQGFPSGILQAILFMILCFKLSVKEKCVAKIQRAI